MFPPYPAVLYKYLPDIIIVQLPITCISLSPYNSRGNTRLNLSYRLTPFAVSRSTPLSQFISILQTAGRLVNSEVRLLSVLFIIFMDVTPGAGVIVTVGLMYSLVELLLII